MAAEHRPIRQYAFSAQPQAATPHRHQSCELIDEFATFLASCIRYGTFKVRPLKVEHLR